MAGACGVGQAVWDVGQSKGKGNGPDALRSLADRGLLPASGSCTVGA